jgi:hypothetical protein
MLSVAPCRLQLCAVDVLRATIVCWWLVAGGWWLAADPIFLKLAEDER